MTELTPERRRGIRQRVEGFKCSMIPTADVLDLLDALDAAETRIAEQEAACAQLDRDSLQFLQETRYDLSVKDEFLRGAIEELEKRGIDGPLLRSLKATVSNQKH